MKKVKSSLKYTLIPVMLLILVSDGFFRTMAEVPSGKGLHFEPMTGLEGESAGFIARGIDFALVLTPDEAALCLGPTSSNVQMVLEGALPDPEMMGMEKRKGKSNYLYGNDPDNWITGVPHYDKVKYEDVYPGVDLVFYSNEGLLEYDFIVSRAGNPDDIHLRFKSDNEIVISNQGDLVFHRSREEVIMSAPVAYQSINGVRKRVKARFTQIDNHSFGFTLGSYDREEALVIDPKIIFSTYLGNNTRARGTDIALDGENNIYITGTNNAINFPVTDSSLIPNFSGPELVFVTKMNPEGTEILYSTYFGGTGDDRPGGVAVDHEGNILVAGQTFSDDFPLVNAIQSTFRGDVYTDVGDGFVTKIDPEGDRFVYSTYMGGAYDDIAHDIAVDRAGNAFVTGSADTENFPFKNPIGVFECGSNGTETGFAAKINPSGGLEFATCLGGSAGYGITTDKEDNVYVTGHSYADGLYTTSGAYQTNGIGPFVLKMDNSGTSVLYSTFISGTELHGVHRGNAIAVDTAGNAYIAGTTSQLDFPVVNAFQPSRSTPASFNQEGFVAKLSPDGSSLLFSSFYGGDNHDHCLGIDVDDDGNMYIIGSTQSTNITLAEAFQNSLNGHNDVFIAKIDGETYELDFSSYLGGSGWETTVLEKNGIALSKNGYVHVTGYTGSTDFPVEEAYQATSTGGDAFVVKFIVDPKGILEVDPDPIVFPQTEPGDTYEKTVELSNAGIGPLEIKSIKVEPAGDYSLEETPGLPVKLEPEQDVEFKIVYTPAGSKSSGSSQNSGDGSLEIESDAEVPLKRISIFKGLIVNDSTDAKDPNPDDNVIDVDPDESGLQVTLRAALDHINLMKKEEVTYVTFDIPGWTVPVIKPLSPLPAVEYPVHLDGSTQIQGYVVLDGTKAGKNLTNGLLLKGGRSTVKSMNVQFFSNYGIAVMGKGRNIIDDCVVLHNASFVDKEASYAGIYIYESSHNKIINSLSSGNGGDGVQIFGEKSTNNLVQGNKIGIRENGTEALGNVSDGIVLWDGCSNNRINNNVVSGNDGNGILIWVRQGYKKAHGNHVVNNIVGLNAAGTDTIPNRLDGIMISNYVSENRVDSNIVAGNKGNGIRLYNETYANEIKNNKVGLDVTGAVYFGNGKNGIAIEYCKDNTIDSNTIIHNSGFGIWIFDEIPRVNSIRANYIGVNKDGYDPGKDRSNAGGGIFAKGARPHIMLNRISGHFRNKGIEIIDGEAEIGHNVIKFNNIGLDIGRSESDLVTDRVTIIHNNRFEKNGTGISVAGTNVLEDDEHMYTNIVGNYIFNSTEYNTGVSHRDMKGILKGNWLSGNSGNALMADGICELVVQQNNFTSNPEFGIENLNPLLIINAHANWWGDPSGPGGQGPGTGDKVSTGVDFASWEDEMITLYVSAGQDTIPVITGRSDSLTLIFENWTEPTDQLHVEVSDDLGWIAGQGPGQITLPTSIGKVPRLYYTVPGDAVQGIHNEVQLKVASLSAPGDSIRTHFYLMARHPAASYLKIVPDTAEIGTGDTIRFGLEAYDQLHNAMAVTAEWSATGGTIENTGMFVAGSEEGMVEVFVSDPVSGLKDTAFITITSGPDVGVEYNRVEVTEQFFKIYPNPFSSATTMEYRLKEKSHVNLRVFNTVGQEIATLVDGFRSPGNHMINWQATGLESGIYFSTIEVTGPDGRKYVGTRILLLVK